MTFCHYLSFQIFIESENIFPERGKDNLPMLTNLTVGGGLKFLLHDANGRKSLANGKNISRRRIV